MKAIERLLILNQVLRFSIILLIKLTLVITSQKLRKTRREFQLLVRVRLSNSFFGKRSARKLKEHQVHAHMRTIKPLSK
jgi:hypothetical protein